MVVVRGFVPARSLLSASFAKRSARRRPVLMPMASFSASYSCIASAASRARSSFAAIAARCRAFFKVVVIGTSSVLIPGFITWAKKSPAAGGPDTGLRTTSFASTSVVKALPVHRALREERSRVSDKVHFGNVGSKSQTHAAKLNKGWQARSNPRVSRL
jgi:hypothetical protein